MRVFWVSIAIYVLMGVLSMVVALMVRGIVAALALTQKAAAPVPVIAPPSPPRPAHQDDIAVISAAVYAMLGSWRVVHIESAEHGRVWTAEARASHHASHNIRHHPKH